MTYLSHNNLLDTTAFAYRNAGTWELFSTNDGDLGLLAYGCTNGNQSQIWTGTITGSFDKTGNTTGFYRPSTGEVWMGGEAIDSNNNSYGLRVFNSSNICPFPQANPTWSFCNYPIPGGGGNHQIDFVRLVYNESNDTMWALWSQPTIANNIAQHLAVAQIPFTCSPQPLTIYYDDVCSNPTSRSIGTPSGVWDSSGTFMHIVMPESLSGSQMHTVFSILGSPHFVCNYDTIGSWSQPSGTSSKCPGFPTYILGGDESNSIREAAQSTIATDRAGNFDNFIVTYSAPGGGDCQKTSETRAYRSTDNGHTWNLQLITGCQNSIQPTVTFAHTPGYPFDVSGRFHIGSTYAFAGSDDLYTVDWKSADDGVTWAGTVIAGPRIGQSEHSLGCSIGDYNGVGADNQNNAFFFNWGEYVNPNNGDAPHFSVQGIVNAN